MNKLLNLSLSLCGLWLFIFSVSATEAKSQNVLGEILRRMDEHNKVLQSLKADLTMVKYDFGLKIADPPMIGRMQYLAKSKEAKNKRWVRIDWTSTDEHISLIGNDYVLYSARLPQVIKGSSQNSKGTPKVSNALGFINMSKAEIKANYSITYLGEEKIKDGTPTWHVQLIPNRPIEYKLTDLWIDKDGIPRQVKTTQLNNDWIAVLISNIKENKSVSLESFKIDYPKSIKPISP
jgi:outer membrane lipoprotein-sorting protein